MAFLGRDICSKFFSFARATVHNEPNGGNGGLLRRRLAVAAIIAVGFFAWRGVLDNGFVYDDEILIVKNEAIRSPLPVSKFFGAEAQYDGAEASRHTWRPLSVFVYAWTYKSAGLSARTYHGVNLALHLGNGLLAYGLLLTLGVGEAAAFWAALIFILHPAQTEAVAWASAQSNLLYLFFYLSAWILFCRRRISETSSIRIDALSLSCFALSLLSKESAASLPGVLVLTWVWFSRREQRKIRDSAAWRALLPYVFLTALYLAARHAALGKTAQTGYWAGGFGPQMLTMLRGFAEYVRITVWPVPLSLEYLFEVRHIPDATTLGCGLLLASLLGLGGWGLKRRKAWGLGILLFFAALAPVSNIIPINTIINERYLYLPILGAALAAACAVRAVQKRLRGFDVAWPVPSALAGACAVLMILTVARIPDFKDNRTLLAETLKVCPHSSRAHAAMGDAWVQSKNWREAVEEYRAALAIELLDDPLLNQIDGFDSWPKPLLERSKFYRRSLQLRVERPKTLANVGSALLRLGEPKKAAGYLSLAKELGSNSPETLNNLAVARAQSGDLARAVDDLKELLRFEPDNPKALHNLRLFEAELREEFVPKLRERFPSLRAKWDRLASLRYEQTPQSIMPAYGYRGSGSFPGELKPEERKALDTLAAREGAAPRALPMFPRRYGEPAVIRYGGAGVETIPLKAAAVQGEVRDGILLYADAYPETSEFIAASFDEMEEFYFLRSPRAPRSFRRILRPLGAVRSFRLTDEGNLSAIGASGALMTLSRPVVIDAAGRRRFGNYNLSQTRDGYELVLAFDSSGLSYPLLIDPAWTTATSMSANRERHTSTLLPNGKVLVAGGTNGTSAVSTAELYDPSAGTWTTTGSMSAAREFHTATLLPGGKVLVVGGSNGSSAVSTAELYDPSVGTWTTTGSMSTVRYYHTATLLSSGKVLVAGGTNGASYLSTAELYDPSAGTWTTTGAMSTARALHTATLLSTGKVLAAGGLNGLGTAELYDPSAGTWTTTGSMTNIVYQHTATLLPSGKVLAAGGVNGSGVATAQLYDPSGGTWTTTGSMSGGRYNHTAALLPNGKVLVAGGTTTGPALSTAELYDPSAGTWTTTGSMPAGRFNHAMTLLTNGQALVTGGDNSVSAFSTVFAYDPSIGAWTNAGAMSSGRYSHTASFLPNGKVLISGGYSAGSLSGAELYDPSAGTWTTTGAMSTARNAHTATLLFNGKILVAGGFNGAALSTAELYDPSAGTWTTTGSMSAARYAHPAVLLANGKVLVAGGFNGATALSTVELYDPAAGTWTTTGSMSAARYHPSATLLPNGKVLVAGGTADGTTGLSTAELYDPTTGTWTTTGSMSSGRWRHTGTLLPNGKVLVAAGNNSGALSTAELYDPSGGTWTTTGALTAARFGHTGTLLPSGKVLVAGGSADGSTGLSTAELYAPAAGVWTTVGAMSAARYEHTATLLPNGKVLEAGGLISGGLNGPTNTSAEMALYTEYDYVSVSPAVQPKITAVGGSSSFPVTLTQTSNITVAGSSFTGVSEGSGGNFGSMNSPANLPRVFLKALGSGSYNTAGRDELIDVSTTIYAHSVSPTALTFDLTSGFGCGYYFLGVESNGVPSTFTVVNLQYSGCPGGPKSIVSAQSGRWADPNTWVGASVPTANDTVTIAAGHVVTVDITTATASATTVNGTLQFSRLYSSSYTLVAGSMTVNGTLDMGTEASPIPAGVYAHLVLSSGTFAGQYGLVINSGGNFSIRGSTKTPAITAAGDVTPTTGLTVNLGQSPAAMGWAVGDQVTIGPTSGFNFGPFADQTEQKTITALGANNITVDSSFIYFHYSSWTIRIADLTRNALVRSSGTIVSSAGGNSAYVLSLAQNTTSFYAAQSEFAYLGGNIAGYSQSGVTLGGNIVSNPQGQISSCTVHHGYVGISIVANQNIPNGYNAIFNKNVVYANLNTGINAYVANYIAVQDNDVFSNQGQGIFMNLSDNSTLTGNFSYSNYGDGVQIGQNIRENALIAGNYVFSNGNIGINGIGNGTRFESNNIFHSKNYAVIANPAGSTFFANNIFSNSSYGLFTGNNDNLYVSNKIYSNNFTALDFETSVLIPSATGNILINNLIYSNLYGFDMNVQSGGFPIQVTAANMTFGYDGNGNAAPNSGSYEIHLQSNQPGALTLVNTRVYPGPAFSTSNFSSSMTYVVSYDQDYATGTVQVQGNFILSGSTMTLDYSTNLYVSTATPPKLMRGVGHSATVCSTSDSNAVSQLVTVRRSGGVWQVVGSSSGLLGSITPGGSCPGTALPSGSSQFNLALTQGGSPQDGDTLDFALIAASGDSNVQKKLLFLPSDPSFNSGKSEMVIAPGSGLALKGASGFPTIMDMQAGGTYYTLIDSGAFTASFSSITNTDPGGIQLSGRNGVAIDNTAFNYMGLAGGTNTFITARSLASTITLTNVRFDMSRSSAGYPSAFNVRVDGADDSLSWNIVSGTGALWGKSFDSDPNSRITWGLPPPSGCATAANVKKDGSLDYSAIQPALSGLAKSMSGNACVVIRDTATYNEQVTVQGFINNGYTIRIIADPGFVSSAPVISPPASSTAAFSIQNASASVEHVIILPVNPLPYGIFASSAYATISSVSVQDGIGNINGMGIVISSYSFIIQSSVTVKNAHGILLLDGTTGSKITYSSAAYSSGGFAALVLVNATNNNIDHDFFSGGNSQAALFSGASMRNTISSTTFVVVSGASGNAVYLSGNGANRTSNNSFSDSSFLGSVLNAGLRIEQGDFNTVVRSTMIGTGGNPGLYILGGGSGNSISDSYVETLGGLAAARIDGQSFIPQTSSNSIIRTTIAGSPLAILDGAYGNTVDQAIILQGVNISTATSNIIQRSKLTATSAGGAALSLYNSSTNTLSQDTIISSNGPGAQFNANSSNNTVSLSTITGNGANSSAIQLQNAAYTTISQSYVQGSSAVYIAGSTATSISGSTLLAVGTYGSGAAISSGSAGVNLTSCTITAGPQGTGIFLDRGNAGLITIATNTISAGLTGLYVSTPAVGTQVWITSNTILPAISNTANTYAINLNGLAAGATIEFNGIYYRYPGTTGSNTAYGIYAQSSSGLRIDHNRISNPGMLTGGSQVGAYLVGAANTMFKFNDINSTGAALTNAYLLQLAAGSTGAQVADNIFSSTVSVTGSSSTIAVDAASQAGFVSNYNDFFSGNARLSAIWGAVGCALPNWSGVGCPSQDANSVGADPLWNNPTVTVEDFHPRAQGGRLNPATGLFVSDALTSLTIDAADPAELVGAEPAPNGGRANQGSYGQTAEASHTAAPSNPPTSPVVAQVYSSSAAISFGIVGASGYIVDASTASNFTGVLYSSSSANPSANVLAPQGLAGNTTYFFRAGALWGASTFYANSTPASTSTLAVPPTNASVYGLFITSATVNWTPMASGTAVGYILQASTAADFSGTVVSSITVGVSQSTLALTGLAFGTNYYYRVGSVNWNGVPNFCPVISAQTAGNTPPIAPVIGSVALSSVTVAYGLNGAAGYVVDASTASDFSGTLFSAIASNSSVNTLAPQGLAADTTYYLRAGALWGATTYYAPTTPATAVTLAAIPSPLSFTGIGLNQFTVSWPSNGNPAGAQYEVDLSTVVSFSILKASVTTTLQTMTFAALTAQSTYFVRVQAINFAGMPSGYASGALVTALGIVTVSANRLPGLWYNNASAFFFAQGASIYHYKVSPNPSDLPAATDPQFNGSALNIGLAQGGNYFHVMGTDSSNVLLGYAHFGPVEIDTGTPLIPLITAQNSASDATPIPDGGTTLSKTPRFSWSNAASLSPIVGYSLSLSTDPAVVPSPQINTTITFSDQVFSVSGTYFAKVSALNLAGTLGPPTSMTINFTTIPSAERLILKNNYFNPLRGGCSELDVQAATPGHLSVVLYTLFGQKVATLNDSDVGVGTYAFTWCGRNQANELVASGIYLLWVEAPQEKKTFKIAVVE